MDNEQIQQQDSPRENLPLETCPPKDPPIEEINADDNAHEIPEEIINNPNAVKDAIRRAVRSLGILPQDRPDGIGKRAHRRMQQYEAENTDTFRMGVRDTTIGEGLFKRNRQQVYGKSKIEMRDPNDIVIPDLQTIVDYFEKMKAFEEEHLKNDAYRQWTNRTPEEEAIKLQEELQKLKDDLLKKPEMRFVKRITSPTDRDGKPKKHWARRIADLQNARDEDGLPIYWYHFQRSPIPFSDEVWSNRIYLKTIVDENGRPDVRARIQEALNIALERDRERHLAGNFPSRLNDSFDLRMDLAENPMVWRVTAWPRILSMTPGLGRRLRINGETVEIRAPGVQEHNIHQRPINQYVEGRYYFSVNTPDWLDFINNVASWINRYPSPPVGLLMLYEQGTKEPISYVIVENPLEELNKIRDVIQILGIQYMERPQLKDPIRLADLLAPGLPDGRPLKEAEYPHFTR